MKLSVCYCSYGCSANSFWGLALGRTSANGLESSLVGLEDGGQNLKVEVGN